MGKIMSDNYHQPESWASNHREVVEALNTHTVILADIGRVLERAFPGTPSVEDKTTEVEKLQKTIADLVSGINIMRKSYATHPNAKEFLKQLLLANGLYKDNLTGEGDAIKRDDEGNVIAQQRGGL